MSDLLSLRIVIGSLGIGGTECHLARLLPELIKKGWSITVITTTARKPNDLSATLEQAGVVVKTQPKWIAFSFLPRYIRSGMHLLTVMLRLSLEFRRNPHSMTHFFLPEAYLIGGCAALFVNCKVPKVMSRRSLNCYQQKRRLLGWLERKLHSKVDFILGNSKAVLKQLYYDEKVPLHKLGLIYNGIDVNSFNMTKRKCDMYKMLNITEEAFIITMIANLIPYKGHRDLITALSNINDKLPANWQLICVGRDDGIKNDLIRLATQLNVQNHIVWLGSYRPVVDVLAVSHVGVLCSHEEGFSNAILEGMAAKLPMVVTDVGGNAEAVVHGKTGLVVPPKDPQSLAQAILSLANNPKQIKRMRIESFQRVAEKFSLQACVEAYHEFYLSLLSSTAPHFDHKILENL